MSVTELITAELDRAYRLALRLTRDPDRAADVVQETCASILAAGEPTVGVTLTRAWFLKAVVHTARDMQKSAGRRRVRERKWAVRNGRKETASPGEVAAGAELRARVREALGLVEEKYRLPLELHYQEGMTHAEIGEVLDAPRGTVGVQISRGLEKLRTELERSGVRAAPAVVIAGLGAAELPAAPPALAASVSNMIAGGALAAKAALGAGGAVAAGGVALAWKLAAGLSVAAALGLGAFGVLKLRPPEPRGAAAVKPPVAAAPKGKKPFTVDVNGPSLRGAILAMRRNGIRVAMFGARSPESMSVPPALRGREVTAKRLVGAIAAASGNELAWFNQGRDALLYKEADDRDVAEFLKNIKSKAAADRRYAAWMAAKLPDPRVLKPLIAAALGEDAEVADYALRSIRRLGWRPALVVDVRCEKLLKRDAAGRHPYNRQTAVKAMGFAGGGNVLPGVRAALKEGRLQEAADTLISVGDGEVIPLARRLLKSEGSKVRAAALKALVGRKLEASIPLAKAALRDESAAVRRRAMLILADSGTPESRKLIIAMLDDKDRYLRTDVIRALGKLRGDDVEKALEKKLAAGGWGKLDAALALARMGNEKGMDHFRQQRKSRHHHIRHGAETILAQAEMARARREKGIAGLKAVLKSSNAQARLAAVRGLAEGTEPEALELLIGAAGDESPLLRSEAIRALADSEDPKARKAVEKALEDSDASVLFAALEASGDLPAEKKISILKKLIAGGSAPIRARALYKLGEVGGDEIAEYIGTVMEGKDVGMRQMAVGVLSRMKCEKARALLKKAAASKDPVLSRTASRILGAAAVGGQSGSLAKALLSESAHTRNAAARVLSAMTERGAMAALRPALKHEKAEVRGCALRVLGAVRGERALPEIQKALADKDPVIRAGAVTGLGAIGGRRVHALMKKAMVDEDAKVRNMFLWHIRSVGYAETREAYLAMLKAEKDKENRRMLGIFIGVFLRGDAEVDRAVKDAGLRSVGGRPPKDPGVETF